jgi:hypothetical protein
MTVEAQTGKLTVVEFYKLAEAGILSEDDRVELLSGQCQFPDIRIRLPEML